MNLIIIYAMIVVQAACPSLVGLNGLVLQETMNTFTLITPSNQEKGEYQYYFTGAINTHGCSTISYSQTKGALCSQGG